MLIDQLNASFHSGRTKCVMGPGGSGRTSLLKALAGKMSRKDVEGLVTLNGTPVGINDFQHIVGFVPKEDELHPNLTIKAKLLLLNCSLWSAVEGNAAV